jgi:long-chain acyl-CoA synthetase
MNVNSAFLSTVKRLPQKPMLFFKGTAFTFDNMYRTTNRLAGGLRAIGVKKNDMVSICLPNGPDLVTTFLAIAKLGAIVIPIDSVMKEKEMEHIFADCPVRAVVTDYNHSAMIVSMRHRGLPVPSAVITVDKKASPQDVLLEEMLQMGADIFETIPVQGQDLILLLYTSGTTGKPKGVMVSHESVLTVARAVARCQQRTEKDSWVLFVPFSHVGGIVNGLIDSVAIGTTFILHERFEVSAFLKDNSTYKCTILPGVQAVFRAILDTPNLDQYDLSNIRIITSGANKLPVEIYKKLKERFNLPILEMYGMTENAATLTSNPMDRQKPGSVGLPLPGMQVRIVGDAGRELPVGEVGEIIARSRGLMQGYYKQPDITSKVLENGWYHTSDLGKKDEDGFIFITGRKDDMINSGGFKIFPAEVEEILLTHADIKDCVVTGEGDERLGQVPVAFISSTNKTLTSDDLKEFCRGKMSNYKSPQRFYFLKSIPRTPTGKLIKGGLLQGNS